jgi:hypothetical protein
MFWPDLYREQGHWFPCIHLAKTLKDAGYSVKFMGIPDCFSIVDPYITDNSFFTTILTDIYPVGHTIENKLEPRDQRWKPAHVLPIVNGALDSVFLGTNRPDLLISGFFTALETLLIHYKYNVKEPALPLSQQVKLALTTTYLRHPADDPAMHAKVKLLYMPRALAQSIIDKVVPPSKVGMDIDTFVQPLTTLNELIPCPRDFDFFDDDWVHVAPTHYVEPMVGRLPLDGGTVTPDPAVTKILTQAAGKRLIYGTSGSQIQDYENQARQLYRNLIAMMQTAGMSDNHLVLAVGSKLLAQFNTEFGVGVQGPSDPGKYPSNVTVVDWIYQLDQLLPSTDVMFTHGGLATVKEAIAAKVPMVVIPHGKDQMDNANRIRRNKLGLVSDVSELNPEQLRNLFTTAKSSAWIKTSLAKMKGLFDAQDQTPPSLGIIQGLVAP